MPNKFHYNGRDANGNAVAGDIEASNFDEVILNLKRHKIIPLNIVPIKPNISISINSLLWSKKIESHHLMTFCRQLAVLTDAGLPLIRAINKLAESTSSRSLSKALSQIASEVSSGLSLSEACRKHPNIFSPLMISIIDIGENTGRLSESLHYLSTYLETAITSKRRLLTTIRYPIIVMIAITIAVIIINIFVIPKFTEIFSRFHLELPLATRMVMHVSSFMLKYKIVIIAFFIIIVLGTPLLLKIPRVRCICDKYMLCIPIFGNLQKKIAISQFAWTFSLILRSGIPIIKGIILASTATTNTYISSHLAKMSTTIEQGEPLSQAAIKTGLFPPLAIQMIEMGEESEKLDDALAEVTKYYNAEIDYRIRFLNELLEPILLAIISCFVLILAIAVYLPMWDLSKITKM